jgi:cell division protein FtsB
MSGTDLLGNQVRAEMKKRRLVFFTFFVLCFIYLLVSLVFGDTGLLKYMELNRTKKNLEKQVVEINSQNEEIKTQIRLLKDDPFYKEKLAREEFGLAKPDEYVFQYDR